MRIPRGRSKLTPLEPIPVLTRYAVPDQDKTTLQSDVYVVLGILGIGRNLRGLLGCGFEIYRWLQKPLPSMLVALAIVASMLFLSLATRTLPISTAYAIWVGIGALGATVCGAIFFGESFSLIRAICLLLLLVAIVGLKMTSPESSHTKRLTGSDNGPIIINNITK